tara:strand:+ start:7858 stop:9333 length:1476 start_codon:yes stop_codon:yes gene_type:complete
MLGKNIIELQEELTYMPMNKLVELVGNPNSEYGSLPLMEIKNRQQLEGSTKQSPTSTVAEDILSTAMTPVGNNSPQPGSTQVPNGGISDIPTQMFAEGRKVRVQPQYPEIRIDEPTPEELRRARELYPDADDETIYDVAVGKDQWDVTGYSEGGIAELFRSNKVDEEELLNLIRNYPEEYKRLKEGEFDSGIGRAFQDMNYVPRIFGIEPTADKYRKKIIKKIDPVRMLDKEYGRGGDFFDSGSLEDFEFFSGLSSDDFDKLQRQKELLKNIDRESLRSEGIEALEAGDTSFLEGLLDPTMGETGLESLGVEKVAEQKAIEKQAEIDRGKNLLVEADSKSGIEALREQLGLQSAEDAQKNKEAILMLGLGSAIGGATDLSDITTGIPSVGKEIMDMDSATAKENLALYTAMAKNKDSELDTTQKLTRVADTLDKMDAQGIATEDNPDYMALLAYQQQLITQLSLGSYLGASQPTLKLNPSFNIPDVNATGG